MTFASLKPSKLTLKRTVETRLSAFGYMLRPVGSANEVFDVVCARQDRLVWLASSLEEIAGLNEGLLTSLRHRTDA